MGDVDSWCRQQGISSVADLVYIFGNFEEAEREAGILVAQASVHLSLAVAAPSVVSSLCVPVLVCWELNALG